MTATWTKATNGAPMLVFVHERFTLHGEEWATVNKGADKSPMTFNVLATDLV